MAAISKASIKSHTRAAGGKRTLFCALAFILCFLALANFLLNQPETAGYRDLFQGGNIEKGANPDANLLNGGIKTTAQVDSNTQPDNKKIPFYPTGSDKKAYLFHHTPNARSAREGGIVLDMLMGHAYAYHQNQFYGGSCGPGNDVGREPENRLIKAIGLQDILQFACPSDVDTKLRKKEIPNSNYQKDGTRSFTPEYVDLLKSVVTYPENKENKYTIVVHISRGKFTPCRNKFQDFDPYLPNKHYQMLIDKYMKPDAKVIIYSQEPSYEKFDEFREKGYELHVEEALEDVWTAALSADVFIMSRSRFSFVPAMLTKAAVVYTPFWDKPLRAWHTVNKDVLEKTEEEFQRLKETCPKKTNPLERFRRKPAK